MSFGTGSGLAGMLKEGSKHLSGVEEAVIRNIEACKQLSQITRTSLGPNGMNKMVINHLSKLFVTHDAATIMRELEVMHPAAKMVVMASQSQEQEIGDGTNFVVVFAGELLVQAENLLRMGLHPSEIVEGYTKASARALTVLDELTAVNIENVKDEEMVTAALKTVLGAKQFGYEDILAPIVARACIQVCPKNPKNFNVDNVRVAKIEGGGVADTNIMKGLVLSRGAEGTINQVKGAKICVFGCPLDTSGTETKGTVLIHNAEELMNYNKSEEKAMEEAISEVAKAGVNVVVCSGNVSELAMHFLERHKIMAVKCPSKFELRRLCKAVGATALVRVGAPTAEEVGSADIVSVEEIGSTKVVVFRRDEDDSGISTILVRGATKNILDDIERAIDDGVNVYKTLARDGRLVPGAGATEIELAKSLSILAEQTPGLDQYAIKKYAESFEVVPRTLAENAGLAATDIISSLYAAHQSGNKNVGVDIDGTEPKDMVAAGVLDSLYTKHWAIRLATDAAVTILRVDQIIMAKPAGGPKPRDAQPDLDED